jgi:hypothetical protein
MTTLPPFRLSAINNIPSVGPPPPAEHVVLDLSRNGATVPDRGGFHSDKESGQFNQIWTSLAEFDRWHQEQCHVYSIEFLLAHTRHGIHYIWKQTYKCGREGSGSEKHYQKKHPDWNRKISTKQTGCTCQLIIKSYPGRETKLGKFIDDHDHPTGIQNLIYTRVSKNAKGKAREMLRDGVAPQRVVCNHCFADGTG